MGRKSREKKERTRAAGGTAAPPIPKGDPEFLRHVLDVLFVPWAVRVYDNGALGGAITYIIAESLMFALGITLVTPYILERTTLSDFVRIVIAGVVMVVAAWPIRERFLALPVALGIVVFPVAILVLRALPPSEREMLRKVLHRVGLGRLAKT